jgi:hypothetical protein
MKVPDSVASAVANRVPDLYRSVFVARPAQARLERRRRKAAGEPPSDARPPRGPGGERRRNVLLITADQQRFDALGCHGHQVAKTPTLDGLAASGIDYRRAHTQNVVCMPSRSTLLTGQHPRTHGVVANEVALPHDRLSVAEVLRGAGYRTSLIGKPHFQPHFDLLERFDENRLTSQGCSGPWYGFDHVETAGHGPTVPTHYTDWLYEHHRGAVGGFAMVLSGDGGDSGAPEVHHNPIPVDQYHTAWCADRAIDHLTGLGDDPWFSWLSFPDPHHPFDPPLEEVRRRINWRDVPLPENHLRGPEAERVLRDKPAHREAWWRGRFTNPEGGPTGVVPANMDGDVLPVDSGSGRQRVLTTWHSQFSSVGMHLRTIHRDGLTCTRYVPTTSGEGGRLRLLWNLWARDCVVPRYDGSEGELYDHHDDPHQRVNRWDDPAYRSRREDLLADLADHLPPGRRPALPVAAPA